jgi:hypothetical protein
MSASLVGEVDADVAQQWQSPGDWTAQPPLQAEKPPVRKRSPESLPTPTPAPPIDQSLRHQAGLWMSAAFDAQQREKHPEVDQHLAWEELMAQFRGRSEAPPDEALPRRKRPAPSPNPQMQRMKEYNEAADELAAAAQAEWETGQ